MTFRFSVLALLLSVPLFSEPVEIMYYNFFGEYLSEQPYQIDVDIQKLSLQEVKQILQKHRQSRDSINSDLVVIGYGAEGIPQEFFAASNNIDSRIPLKLALAEMPIRSPHSKWQIYFVDRYLSSYVRAKKDHHWASPFRWLANIGLQDLQYFDTIDAPRARTIQ